jgi:hypothetical protein
MDRAESMRCTLYITSTCCVTTYIARRVWLQRTVIRVSGGLGAQLREECHEDAMT